jgi:hypothetical protein
MTFDLTATIVGIIVAAFLTPLEGPVQRLLGRFAWVTALVWLAIAGVLDACRDLYGP